MELMVSGRLVAHETFGKRNGNVWSWQVLQEGEVPEGFGLVGGLSSWHLLWSLKVWAEVSQRIKEHRAEGTEHAKACYGKELSERMRWTEGWGLCAEFRQKEEIGLKSMWTGLGSFEIIFKASVSFLKEMSLQNECLENTLVTVWKADCWGQE